ncbi:chorismate-binding protein [Brachybacterium hainanense]|uniref:anthranilate synthase n=1 Tax=Brachybacterium hainanense TaxID=1541174 RepID=A0ABV6RAG9_9MICO
MTLPLDQLARSTEPFALLSRPGATGSSVELLRGDVLDVAALADIPLDGEVLALVPYAQIRERGYPVADDGTPLRCLRVRERELRDRRQVLAELPAQVPGLSGGGFDVPDEEYARTVRTVIEEEIGRGEGANFVIRRDYLADVEGAGDEPGARGAALAWFRALLERERGAYWTFAIVAGDRILVGASPEAHVVVRGGEVMMNPISGTFRHGDGAPSPAAFLDFLASQKETEELFMVVDEEMKMMSAVCADGGRITGPHLKQMSRLTHTEYVLRGRSGLDPRQVLRETMFAPTVTGSPMQNATAVIARHEQGARGYYSGVAALFTPNGEGGHDLDAPILIRTAYLERGRLRVPVGATLVRHSDPDGEVAETHAKSAGVLGAIGALPRTGIAAGAAPDLAAVPGARELLEARNATLAAFWLEEQGPGAAPFAGASALIVDAEDRFTTMLAHQLRRLGLGVEVMPWDEVTDARAAAAQLLVAGPGPGDPRHASDPRIARMRQLVSDRLGSGGPLLAVCLSHQLLSLALGLELAPLPAPHQGVPLEVDLFGTPARIGFYNTFAAHVRPGIRHIGPAQVAADPVTGQVHALRGDGFASVQGHLESVLSRDGIRVLEGLLGHVLPRTS